MDRLIQTLARVADGLEANARNLRELVALAEEGTRVVHALCGRVEA